MTRLVGLALALALLGALVAGTRAPYAAYPGDGAVLRLAWRALGEASLRCRTPSAEELARLPVHMRRQQICERRLPTFVLRVAVDGERLLDERIAPAGAAGDRAAVVLRELPLAPGVHRLEVEFAPEEVGGAGQQKRLEREIRLAPGEVALVLEDAATRELVVRTR
jgi:hypothetical protein